MAALVGLGVAIAVVGGVILAEEWRACGRRSPRRVNGSGLRVEVVALAAILIGVGVAIGYAGVSG